MNGIFRSGIGIERNLQGTEEGYCSPGGVGDVHEGLLVRIVGAVRVDQRTEAPHEFGNAFTRHG